MNIETYKGYAEMIYSSVTSILGLIMEIVLILCLGFGLITGPATDDPIEFQSSEDVEMSFVLWADTHTRNTAINPYYIGCGLEDIANSGEEFDALVIAGDLSEFGDPDSYAVLWDKLESSTMAEKPMLLATGNHDIRLAYEAQTEMIMNKASEYLGTEIDKPYYSYDVKGYTFIVLGSDEWQFEKAVISDEQLQFLDSELERATASGKPAFVICHQPLDNTHGLPEVWENGGLGKNSGKVKEILMRYDNVFYLCGHLHDGVYEKSLEVFSEEDGVYSISAPAYGKENDYGAYSQTGLGDYVEVYSDRVVFTARDFQAGKSLEGMTYTFYLK